MNIVSDCRPFQVYAYHVFKRVINRFFYRIRNLFGFTDAKTDIPFSITDNN